MKLCRGWGLCLLLGLVGLVQPLTAAEPFGSPSLLPMPSVQPSRLLPKPIKPASYGGFQEETGSSDSAPQPLAPARAQPQPGFAPPPVELSPDYQRAMNQPWDGSGCADGSCNAAIAGACGPACPHIAVWGSGLVMGRANQCDRPVSQDAITLQSILSTNDAGQDWSGGFEAGGAWIMPNCCNAIAVNYWGLFGGHQTATVNAADYPGGILPLLGNIDRLSYSDGTTTNDVYTWMSTGSGMHHVTSSITFHSVEINFLGNTQAWGLVPYGAGGSCNGCDPCGGCGPSRWQFGWLAGVRYFEFDELCCNETDASDAMIGDPNDLDELTYRIDTSNTLWGFQMGGQGAWYLRDCFSIYGSGRFGVFNNYATSEQYVTGQAGDAFINSGTFSGTDYRFSASRNALAGLGQIDLGARYQLGSRWSMYGGYRVVGLSGVAIAPSQINVNFASPKDDVCTSDSILLHGAFMGGQFAW